MDVEGDSPENGIVEEMNANACKVGKGDSPENGEQGFSVKKRGYLVGSRRSTCEQVSAISFPVADHCWPWQTTILSTRFGVAASCSAPHLFPVGILVAEVEPGEKRRKVVEVSGGPGLVGLLRARAYQKGALSFLGLIGCGRVYSSSRCQPVLVRASL